MTLREVPLGIADQLQPPYAAMYSRLTERLNTILRNPIGLVETAAACAVACNHAYQEVAAYSIAHPFKTQPEEIRFFKYVSPCFKAQSLFYFGIYLTEANKPAGGEKAERKYLKRKQRVIASALEDCQELFSYYRRAADHNDTIFFSRQKDEPAHNAVFPVPRDDEAADMLRNILVGSFIGDGFHAP
jgi:hypothetical protein